jgi:Ca-activated chloride channel family protein
MSLASFHFSHPLWLLGLGLIPAGWVWSQYWQKHSAKNLNFLTRFIDEKLLPYLLLNEQQSVKKNKSNIIYALLVTCLVISLANPRWNFNEIDAYAPTASMVILLDLSSTMAEKDVAPSRVIRARQHIEDLLNLSKGLKVGLIGFAANPHIISPITDDVHTIKGFLPALDTDLISKQGNALAPALNLAKELLKNEPGEKKSILLVSDGNFSDKTYVQVLKSLTAANIGVYVMGISKSNQGKLQEIAKIGNGIYIEASHSDKGLQAILNKAEMVDSTKQQLTGKIRNWEDRYYLFLIPAIGCLLYLMSQRVFYTLLLVVTLSIFSTNQAHAFELKSLFTNSNQKAQQQFSQANFAEAGDLFKDSYNKGVALYRAGNFCAAEKEFKNVQSPELRSAATYNAGNAQMQMKKWRAAIKSYKQVLETEPDHTDAKFNLALAEKMLAENGEEEPPKDQDQEQEGDKNSQQSDQGQDNNDQNQNQNKNQNQKQNQPPAQQQNQPSDVSSPNQDSTPSDDSTPADDSGDGDTSTPADDAAKKTQQKQMSAQSSAAQEARAEQWLNRVHSDIKVFLRNKFYIEDMLSTK